MAPCATITEHQHKNLQETLRCQNVTKFLTGDAASISRNNEIRKQAQQLNCH
jgi:hypothetical protein